MSAIVARAVGVAHGRNAGKAFSRSVGNVWDRVRATAASSAPPAFRDGNSTGWRQVSCDVDASASEGRVVITYRFG